MSANYRSDLFECQQCDSQIFSQCYLNYTVLNQGYWRQSLQVDKRLIQKCQNTSQQSCIGGSRFRNELCSEERIGNECSACDETSSYWNATYTSANLYSCIKCDDIQSNSIKIWVGIILFTIILLLLIHSNFKKIQNQIYRHYLLKMQMVCTSFTKFGLASVFIKVLSFSASLLSFIQNQLEISVKDTLIKKSIQYTSPLQTSFASINCAIYNLFPNQQHYGIIIIKLYLVLPLLVIPLALIFPLIRFLFKKSSPRFLKYNIYLTIIYTHFIVFYNQILSVCLDSLTCRSFGNGEKALQIDLTLVCSQGHEYYLYSLGGLVLFSISVPTYLINSLISNRNKLNYIQTLFQFGFLYQEYKKQFYFWEITRFSVKVSFLIIQKIFFQNKQLMNSLFIIVLIFYQYCLQRYQPFQRMLLNKIEMISIQIVLLNFIATIVFQTQSSNIYNNFIDYIPNIFLYVCLLSAHLFMKNNSVIIFISFAETIISKIQSNSKFTCIIRYFPQFQLKQNLERALKNLQRLRNQVKYITQFKNQQVDLQDTIQFLQD
ncbi:hypothetical protein ABPG72_005459 [Tetrahymena utriculariae]